jgi:hypothetical protein
MRIVARFLAVASVVFLCRGVYAAAPVVGVGPQYDSTHVYVAPQDFDRLIASFIATFTGPPGSKAFSP